MVGAPLREAVPPELSEPVPEEVTVAAGLVEAEAVAVRAPLSVAEAVPEAVSAEERVTQADAVAEGVPVREGAPLRVAVASVSSSATSSPSRSAAPSTSVSAPLVTPAVTPTRVATHHVTALAQCQIGGALGWPLEVTEQVGATDLDLVHHRLDIGGHRGVTDREDVGLGHCPSLLAFLPRHLGAQPQAAPSNTACARHLLRNPSHQGFMRIEVGPVLLAEAGDEGNARVGQSQGFAATVGAHPREQAGGKQFEFHRVLAGPA
jgi:hypothetical protein